MRGHRPPPKGGPDATVSDARTAPDVPAVLLNANAKLVGRRIARRLEALVSTRNLFWSETLEETEEHAKTILERGYSRLFIGGGDGTFAHTITRMEAASQAVAEMSGAEPAWPAIGILRLGTGNALGHLARAGAVEADVIRHVEALRAPVARLPLIRDSVSGLSFPFGSLGYDAGALNDYATATGAWRHPWSRRIGRSLAGYGWSLATRTLPRELGKSPTWVTVEAVGPASRVGHEADEELPLPADTVLFEGPARAVVAGTSPFYGYGIRALPFAQRRTDRLHVRVSTATAVFLLSHLPTLWSGELRSPDLHDFLVEGVRVESETPIPVQWAGEAGGHAQRIEWRLSGRSVELLGGTGRRAPQR